MNNLKKHLKGHKNYKNSKIRKNLITYHLFAQFKLSLRTSHKKNLAVAIKRPLYFSNIIELNSKRTFHDLTVKS